MKNKFSLFTAICFAMLAFAACEKPVSQLAIYVPKDASAVFTIDTKAIMDKIASSGITIDSLANMLTKNNDEFALHWNDIKNSGINLNKPLYAFVKQTNSIQQGNIQSSGIIAEIDDAKKIEAFLKKEKVGADVLSGGKYQYIALGDDYVAGWTDKILIISNVSGGNASPGKYSTGEGTLSQLQLTTLFTQNESASIASLGEFRDMLAKPGDIHFFTNASMNLGNMGMLGMTKANALLQGTYSEGAINFDKGKIIASGETHYNKTLTDILDKYPSKEINLDMIKSYPDTLSGFGIIAFNPKVLVDILHYLGFDMMADGFTSNMGFTTTDVVNAFSGDIAVMFSPRSDKTMGMMPHTPGFLLSIAIGDKTAFDKVLNGLLNKQILTKNGDEYQLGLAGGHGFVIETGNNNLFISSSDELIKAYQSGSKNALPADVEKEVSNKSMAVYVDINTLLNNKSAKDSSVNIHLRDSHYIFNISQAAKATFKNLIATTDKSDGKSITGNFELNFVNTNENSLASLVKFISIAHEEEMKHKNDPQMFPPPGMMNDSTQPDKDDN